MTRFTKNLQSSKLGVSPPHHNNNKGKMFTPVISIHRVSLNVDSSPTQSYSVKDPGIELVTNYEEQKDPTRNTVDVLTR